MTSLKILIVPSVIVFAIICGVFWIYPEYQDIQTQKGVLQARENALEQGSRMQRNSQSLLADFRENSANVAFVLRLLPRQGEEEAATWLIAQSAQSSGASLVLVALDTPPATKNVVPVAEVSGGSKTVDSSVSVQAGTDVLTLNQFSVKFTVAGTYESFKQFLGTLNMIPRQHRISSLSLEKKIDEKKQESLQLSGTVAFSFAPMKKMQPGVISPAFEKASFDYEFLSGMKSGEEKYVIPMETSSGRPNPFLP